jgi:hypothetical protein
LACYYFTRKWSADRVEDSEVERAIWSFQLEQGLPVKAGAIRKIAAEPMEADTMGAGTFNSIHHYPEVVLDEKYGSPV